jgi:hypothetical protein
MKEFYKNVRKSSHIKSESDSVTTSIAVDLAVQKIPAERLGCLQKRLIIKRPVKP